MTSYSQNDFKKYICTQKSNRWAGWVAFVLSFIDLSVKVDRDSNRMNSLLVWTGKILWLSSQLWKLLAKNSETWLQWHLEQNQQFYPLWTSRMELEGSRSC